MAKETEEKEMKGRRPLDARRAKAYFAEAQTVLARFEVTDQPDGGNSEFLWSGIGDYFPFRKQ